MTRFPILIFLAAMIGAMPAAAEYDPGESYDGTVATIRWLDAPKPAEAFTFKDDRGQVTGLDAFRGKVLLVNLWATWCPPCLRELPTLDRLQLDLGGDNFTVVPISVDRLKPAAVEAFYEKLEIKNLGLYLDPWQQSKKAFRIDTLPASYLLDRQGRILGYVRSYVDWSAPESRALLEKMIHQGRP